MEFNRLGLTPIVIFNLIIWVFFTFAYLYQFVYILVTLRRGEVKLPEAKRNHRYAFFIAAHNEESVIANLVQSIKQQDYPSEFIDVFVVADACTDRTAKEARRAGAIVYERNDLARKGKSWVLDYGFDRILNEYPDKYEAFFVFDADNLLSPTYVREMNKVFDQGYLVATSYRNSKNFDSSWISSAYALWFLREASSSTTRACNLAPAAPSRARDGWCLRASSRACTAGTSTLSPRTSSSRPSARPTASRSPTPPRSSMTSSPSR